MDGKIDRVKSPPAPGLNSSMAKPADGDPFADVVAYVPPAAFLRRLVHRSEDGESVTMSLHSYRKLLECALIGVYDDAFYRAAYPDVDKAVAEKTVPSSIFHFMVYGYAEGRPPMRYQVDETWYLKTYPDVAAAVQDGRLPSGAVHFENFGYAEGRAPNADYEGPVKEWRAVQKLPAKASG
jgi:hypothetical protein